MLEDVGEAEKEEHRVEVPLDLDRRIIGKPHTQEAAHVARHHVVEADADHQQHEVGQQVADKLGHRVDGAGDAQQTFHRGILLGVRHGPRGPHPSARTTPWRFRQWIRPNADAGEALEDTRWEREMFAYAWYTQAIVLSKEAKIVVVDERQTNPLPYGRGGWNACCGACYSWVGPQPTGVRQRLERIKSRTLSNSFGRRS